MIQQYQQYCTDIKESLDQLPWHTIQETVEKLHEARTTGRRLFVIGNGGSAATASHMACDLMKNINIEGYPRFQVMDLSSNVPLLSALANDDGYEHVFAEPLLNWAQPNDILLAISTSGNSPNILRAVEYARSQNLFTIGWSGYQGGALHQLVDLSLVVSNTCVEQIEDIHMMLEHMVTVALRNAALANLPIAVQTPEPLFS